jgi:ABC-type glycerol-3-phosphate transport system substrate-binding protein
MSRFQAPAGMSRRAFAGKAGATIAAAAMAAGLPIPNHAYAQDEAEVTPEDRVPEGDRAITLEFFSSFGGILFDAFSKIASDYEATQPDVGIKISYSPGHAENPRLLTTLAAGDAPDIAMMVDFQNAQYVELGVVTDLTDRYAAAGLTQEDMYPAAWNLMSYKDRVWHLPFEVDPNFPMFWNKAIFAEAGLDPEVGPATFDDIDAFSQAIFREEDGLVTRIGIIPWDTYGFANSIYTWGWSFGGSFFDPEANEVTPDNDQVVAALEWMVEYAKTVGGPDKVSVAPPNLGVHSIAAGNLGMAPLVTPNYRDALRYNEDLELGNGLLPIGGAGTDPGQGAWTSGWRLFIPTGAKNEDAAWDFIHWMTATDEGTRSEWTHMGFIPGWTKAPVNEEIKADPVMSAYFDTLLASKFSKEPIPVGAYYQGQLEEKVSQAIYGELEPRAALEEVKQLTMAEWERFGR